MSSRDAQGEVFVVLLLGQKDSLKQILLRDMLNSEERAQINSDCVVGQNGRLRVVCAPDLFSDQNRHLEQHLLDLTALSLPGPNLLLLAVDRDSAEEETVAQWIVKLQCYFGDSVCGHLLVALPDIESFHALRPLQARFGTALTMANEQMSREWRRWCRADPFVWEYPEYGELVRRRQRALRNSVEFWRTDPCTPALDPGPLRAPSCPGQTGDPPVPAAHGVYSVPGVYGTPGVHHGPVAPAEPAGPGAGPLTHAAPAVTAPPPGQVQILQAPVGGSLFFNIVLLGSSGVGKSSSGNTILAAARSKSRFNAALSSDPVTVETMAESVQVFGTKLTVVDTPDFFHDKILQPQVQAEKCRRFLVPGHFMVLLVLKVDRFREPDLLGRLEQRLGVRLRDDTWLLMTHGEELDGPQSEFFNANPELRRVAEQTSYRSHTFNNKRRSSGRQVVTLLQKVPQQQHRFPRLQEHGCYVA